MNGDGILRWIYRYALENMFDSNLRAMALVLRVSERTLQKAFDNDNTAESLLVFEQLMEYCMRNQISVDAIIAHYVCIRLRLAHAVQRAWAACLCGRSPQTDEA